jgi:hypothetical protein
VPIGPAVLEKTFKVVNIITNGQILYIKHIILHERFDFETDLASMVNITKVAHPRAMCPMVAQWADS